MSSFFGSLLNNEQAKAHTYSISKRGRSAGLDTLFTFKNERYEILFDGVLFDAVDAKKTISILAESHCITEDIKTLNGSFFLVVYSKADGVLNLITDHLASKKLFYQVTDAGIHFSNNLFDLPIEKKDKFLDEASIYFYLGFGFYKSGTTFVDGVKQVEPGSRVEFNQLNGTILSHRYHQFSDTKIVIEDEEVVLSTFESKINRTISNIAKFNIKNGFSLSSSLSGGLDAKTVVAKLRGFYPNETINTSTFAQYGSLDQKIAQSVSQEMQTSHLYYSLDNGTYLYTNVDEYIQETSGLISCHGSLHTFNMYKKINPYNVGIHLSGQIGDVIFGSAIKKGFCIKNDFKRISYTGNMPDFIADKILRSSDIFDKYKGVSYEIFNIEQRQVNGTIFGDVCLQRMFGTVSPFYDKELIEYSLSIPDELKLHEKLYIKWLSAYCPSVQKFKWDKSNCKPTSYNWVRLMKYVNTIKNGVLRRLNLNYNNMNPFDRWLKENPNINNFLDTSYQNNIANLSHYPQLQSDVRKLYDMNNDKYSRNKFAVVTLLIAISKLR